MNKLQKRKAGNAANLQTKIASFNICPESSIRNRRLIRRSEHAVTLVESC
jgi:hypothetical protein